MEGAETLAPPFCICEKRAQDGDQPRSRVLKDDVLFELAMRDGRGGDPLDNQVMRQKLIAMNNIETIWGPIKFSSKGRIESAGLPVIQWQGKDPALKVLHPPALKTGDIVYPTPPWSKRG